VTAAAAAAAAAAAGRKCGATVGAGWGAAGSPALPAAGGEVPVDFSECEGWLAVAAALLQ
jgi:hypothetical protein